MPCWRATAAICVERRRGLPGDPDDTHSRYLEASAHGMVVASIYLPNGNPQPGPKFAYKLAWFERLIEHAASLIDSAEPVLLVGDYNVVATDGKGDIYNPASWKKDALLQPESRDAYRRLLAQGWTDAIHALHEGEPIYTFWDYFRDRFARDAGLRIDHLLLNAPATQRLRASRRRPRGARPREAERPRPGVGGARLRRRNAGRSTPGASALCLLRPVVVRVLRRRALALELRVRPGAERRASGRRCDGRSSWSR